MSPTLKSTGGGSLWEERVDRDVSQILTRWGKRRRVDDIFCRLSTNTMHERDRQTDGQPRNSNNIDTNRRNRFSAMSPKTTAEHYEGVMWSAYRYNAVVPSHRSDVCTGCSIKNIRFTFSSFLTQMLINSNEISSKCAP